MTATVGYTAGNSRQLAEVPEERASRGRKRSNRFGLDDAHDQLMLGARTQNTNGNNQTTK